MYPDERRTDAEISLTPQTDTRRTMHMEQALDLAEGPDGVPILTWHSSLPWDHLKRLYALGRKRWFSKPRPEGTYLRVEAPEENPYVTDEYRDQFDIPEDRLEANEARLTRLYGYESFHPNWEFSYNKKGEILNLAQPLYEEQRASDAVWWQTHLRGWEGPGDAIDLRAHWEASPTEHWREHLHGTGTNVSRAMDRVEATLDGANVEYEEVYWSRD